MNAGHLTEKIEILRKAITVNEYSEEVETWNVIYTTRAALLHKSGSKAVENNEVRTAYTKEFTVWYYVDIDEFDKIKWNNKYYNVLDITPNKANNNKIITVELVNE